MKRLQRLRGSRLLRDLCAQTEFTTSRLIQPLFVVEDIAADEDVPGLRGTRRMTADSALRQIDADLAAGVRHFILFNVPHARGPRHFTHDFASRVIHGIKERFGGDLHLWVDTCLCSLTEHGHCCVFQADGRRDHAATLDELAHAALSYVQAGADGVSPSDMMDGRTAHIRARLDAHGFEWTPLMSYSTKFASNFYGPFRHAAECAPQFGDRSEYQIDVRNRRDAINAGVRCAEEGADLLLVKPAMTSLDLIKPIEERTGLGVGAYQVSGEYAGLVLLAEHGLLAFEKGLLETWHVLLRGGAQFIITYGARYAVGLGVKA